MFENLILFFAASSLGWSLINVARRNRPVAVGAAISATVLCGAFVGTTLPLMAWVEGGYGMNVLALSGSYALGAAGAFLLSGKSGAKWAALVAAGVTAVLAGAFYADGLREIDEVLRQVTDVHDAELIREGSRGELLRLLELAGLFVLSTALILIGGRPRGRQPESVQAPEFIGSSR